MGLINRESTAPIKAGELTSGTEVENEFNKIFTLIGLTSGSEGNIDDSNIKGPIDAAKLNNTAVTTAKIKDGDIPGSKINNGIITTSEFVATSLMQANVDTTTTADAFTTSSSFVDIPSVTAWTVTPGEGNYIQLDYTFGVTATGGADRFYLFGFSVDGSNTGVRAKWDISSTLTPNGFHFSWSTVVTSSGSIVCKPIYAQNTSSGGSIAFTLTRVFRGIVIPVM